MNTIATAPAPAFSESLRRGTKAYDLLAAAPLMVGYALSAAGNLGAVAHGLAHFSLARPNVTLALTIISKLGGVTLLTLFMAMLLLRRPPISKACGWAPRIAALVGTYLSMGILMLNPIHASAAVLAISTAMMFGGTAFAIYSILYLGRSFSLMAEARKLVTSGPYSRIRHPLYAGEEIAILGAFLQYVSPLATLLLALQIAAQVYRMSCEEDVLAGAFPDYVSYKSRTFRLIPGIY